MKIWTMIAVLAATPAMAEKREMPDYLVDAIVASTTARTIAMSCPDLSVNPIAANRASTELITKLEADGISTDDPISDVLDDPERFAARQQAFMDKHDLDGAPTTLVCDAGRAEMAEGTGIGALLIEEGK
ncbi:DUF5333 family protein [Litoreibacter ponti]|nr:DUF5333 family protein [Litoreibacter ponti]